MCGSVYELTITILLQCMTRPLQSSSCNQAAKELNIAFKLKVSTSFNMLQTLGQHCRRPHFKTSFHLSTSSDPNPLHTLTSSPVPLKPCIKHADVVSLSLTLAHNLYASNTKNLKPSALADLHHSLTTGSTHVYARRTTQRASLTA